MSLEWMRNRCGSCGHTHHQHRLVQGRCERMVRQSQGSRWAWARCVCSGWIDL